jgi:integral membrane protein 2B
LFSSDSNTGFNIDIADMETDLANELRKDHQKRTVQEQYFRELFELDLNDDNYADVQVPDFRDGRSGRYVHDFKYNQTGIIDSPAKHCFVMDLDRETVMRPRDLFDIINKMYSGYYDINTDVIRKEMRVVLPPLNDEDKLEISPRIVETCAGSNIYRLEKFIGGVVKRSIVVRDEQKFGGLFGKNIVEYDLVNFEAVDAYEHPDKH